MRILEVFVALFFIASRQNASSFSPFVVPSRPSFSQPIVNRNSVPHSFPLKRHQTNMLSMYSTGSTSNNESDESRHMTLRDRLRQVTGFSFTAFRATLRGITGISLTALYASAVATTSSFVRNIMKLILSAFPSWVRSCCSRCHDSAV